MAQTVDKAVIDVAVDPKNAETGVNAIVSALGRLEEQGKKQTALLGATLATNIWDPIVNAAKGLIKPMTDGLAEYEEQLKIMQTMSVNTGASTQEISDALLDLNTYADQTIYSFKDMTMGMGLFTAATGKLEGSGDFIKGIYNLAAGMGATLQQSKTAMIQLTQAVSSGTVKAQDWNSVVNAGLGGPKFRNALIENAKALMIQNGATVELDKTEAKLYAQAQKRAAAAEESLGTLAQQIQFKQQDLNILNKRIDELAREGKATDTLVQQRERMLFSISEMEKKQAKLTNEMHSSNQEVDQFNAYLADTDNAFGVLENAADNFKGSLEQGWLTSEVLVKTLQDFASDESLLDAATKIKTYTQAMDTLAEGVGSAWSQIMYKILGDGDEAAKLWTAFFNMMEQGETKIVEAMNAGFGTETSMMALDGIRKAFIEIFNEIGKVIQAFMPFEDIMFSTQDAVVKFLGIVVDVKNIIVTVGDYMISNKDTIKSAIESLVTPFKMIFDIISNIVQVGAMSIWNGIVDERTQKAFKDMEKALNDMWVAIQNVREAFAGGDKELKENKLVHEGTVTILQLFAGAIEKIAQAVTWVADKIIENKDVIDGFVDTLSKPVDFVKKFTGKIVPEWLNEDPDGKKVKEVIDGIGQHVQDYLNDPAGTLSKDIKATIKFGIEIIDNIKGPLNKWLSEIKTYIGTVSPTLAGIITEIQGWINNLTGDHMTKGLKIIDSEKGVWDNFKIIIGKVWDFIKFAADNLKNILGEIGGFAIDKIKDFLAGLGESLGDGSKSLGDFLKNVDWDKVVDNLINMAKTAGVIILVLAIASKIMGSAADSITKAIIAVIVGIIAVLFIIKSLNDIDIADYLQGIALTGAIMLAIPFMVKLLAKALEEVDAKTILATLSGITATVMATTNGLKDLAQEDPLQIILAAAALAAILFILSKFPVTEGSATALIAASAGILVMSFALSNLAQFDVTQIGLQMIVILAILTALGLIDQKLNISEGISNIGKAIFSFFSGIAALIASIALLAGGIGLLIISLIGLVLVAPLIIAMGDKFIVAMNIFGTGIAAFISGLATGLVLGMGDFIISLINELVRIIGEVKDNIIELLAMVAAIIGQGIVVMIQVIGLYAPEMVTALSDLLVGVFKALAKEIGPIVDAVFEFIVALLKALAAGLKDHGADFLAAAFEFLMQLILAVITSIPKIAGKIWDFIVSLWDSIIEAINNFDPEKFGQAVIDTLSAAWDWIKDTALRLFDGVKNFFKGLFSPGDTEAESVAAAQQMANDHKINMQAAYGIKSPSKLMRDEVGKYIGEGINEGTLDAVKDGQNKFEAAFKKLGARLSGSWNNVMKDVTKDWKLEKYIDLGEFNSDMSMAFTGPNMDKLNHMTQNITNKIEFNITNPMEKINGQDLAQKLQPYLGYTR